EQQWCRGMISEGASWRLQRPGVSSTIRLKDPFSFPQREDFPVACRQSAQLKIANLHSNQSQRRMADGCGHAARLPVSPFDQFQSDPAVGHILPEPNRRIAWGQLPLWLQ